MFRIAAFQALLLVWFLPVACVRSPLLLKVGDVSWTGKDFQKEISLYLKGLPVDQVDSGFIKKKVLEELVFKSLLEIWAKKNIKNWPASFSSPQERKKFLHNSLKEHLQISVSEEEKKLRGIYRKNREKFYRPEQCFLEQILVSEENLAAAIYRRLLKGEDFETLAQIYSSGRKTSEIGWVSKGTLKIFDTACDNLSVGAFSKPLKSFYGVHILKVKRKKPGEQQTFSQVREKILKEIKEEAKEASFQKWLKKELKASSVFLNEKLLDNIQIKYKKRLL